MMILVAIGSNLSSAMYGAPMHTCNAAVSAMGEAGVTVKRRSRWYGSLPVPASDQPNFVNGMIEIETSMIPGRLMRVLHSVECTFGRQREQQNAARVLDLDLVAYGATISANGCEVELPHPRMHERLFVLKPLVEFAPQWRHPRLGLTAMELLAYVPPGQVAWPIEEGARFGSGH